MLSIDESEAYHAMIGETGAYPCIGAGRWPARHQRQILLYYAITMLLI
jgi:hypothetical protein